MPEGRKMTQAAAQEQKVEQSVSLAALFTAFLIVSLCGIGGGGGIVWARDQCSLAASVLDATATIIATMSGRLLL
jgi:hypothetical protein